METLAVMSQVLIEFYRNTKSQFLALRFLSELATSEEHIATCFRNIATLQHDTSFFKQTKKRLCHLFFIFSHKEKSKVTLEN